MAVYINIQPLASTRSFLVFNEPSVKGEALKIVFSEKVMPPSVRLTMETRSTSQSQSHEPISIASSVPGPSSAAHTDDCKENVPPASPAVLRIAVEDCGITTVSLSILQGM